MKKIIFLLTIIFLMIDNQARSDQVNIDYQQCKIELSKCLLVDECLGKTLEHAQSCHQTWNKIIDFVEPFFKSITTNTIKNFPDFYLLNYEGQDGSLDDAILTPQGELIDITGFSYATVDFDKIEQLKVADLQKILPSFVKSEVAEDSVSYKFSKIDNQIVLTINALIISDSKPPSYVQRTYTFDANGKIVNLRYAFFC